MLASLSRATFADGGTERLILWINRFQEALWLLVIVLVPLVYLGRDFGAGSSVLGSFELPKIVLLRTFVGLMVALWLIEWGLRGPDRGSATSREGTLDLRPLTLLASLGGWLRESSNRWLILAVAIFLTSTLISTVFSGSFKMSLWGETPGQDSYSAYTTVGYVLLFVVIATHLKTPSQLWRLLGSVVVMGVLVSGYSILQYYDLDFLNLREPITNLRSTSTLSNTILAGSVMLFGISISLATATISLRGAIGSAGFWAKLSLWSLVLGVQLLGLLFTFSRGPWVSTLVAAVVIMVSLAAFGHWRILVRVIMMLALAVGVAWMIAFVIPKISVEDREVTPSSAGERATSAITSIVTDTSSVIGPTGGGSGVLVGGLGARIQIWKESWGLMTGNPWFGFDSLGLSFFRPLVGYGPDFFRATHLLVATGGTEGLISEFVHAHNYFVHQGVELGFLGLAASLGIYAAVLLAAAYQLIWHRRTQTTIHRLILIGLLAVLIGRMLEQMVGIARVSDLTLWWVLLAVFAALPAIMQNFHLTEDVQSLPVEPDNRSLPRVPDKLSRGRKKLKPKATDSDKQLNNTYRWKFLGRLIIIICLVVGIGLLSWVKGVNYIRAAVIADQATAQFQEGDAQSALSSLDHSIKLAPGVSTYYEKRDIIYSLIQARELYSLHPKCGFLAENRSRAKCLAEEQHQSNLKWVENRPLYHKAKLALAGSFLNLALINNDSKLASESIQHYRQITEMLPASFPALNKLADASILLGQPQLALGYLEKSMILTENLADSYTALLLEAEAYHNLGQVDRSLEPLGQAIIASPGNREPYFLRGSTYRLLGQLDLAVDDLSKAIDLDPEYGAAFYTRALVYTQLGKHAEASEDIDQAVKFGVDPNILTAAIEEIRDSP